MAAAYLTGTALLLPTLVLLNILTEQTVPPAVLTQTFTWNNSASAAGVALAAILAGRAADTWGAATALGQAPAAGLILLILALVLTRKTHHAP